MAQEVVGVDRVAGPHTDIVIDLDKNPYMYHTSHSRYDIIVAGEILEHLANPGRFLEAMRHFTCPLIITTPNAFSQSGMDCVKQGYENVNKDHVAYYTYTTLKTLAERYRYRINAFFWDIGVPGRLGNKPNIAEGIIAVLV